MNEFQYGYTKKEKIKRIVLILAIVVLVILGIIVYSNQKYKEKEKEQTSYEKTNSISETKDKNETKTKTKDNNNKDVEKEETNNQVEETPKTQPEANSILSSTQKTTSNETVSSTKEKTSNFVPVEENQKESSNTSPLKDEKEEVQEETIEDNNIITEQIVLSDDASKSYSYIIENEESYQVQLPTVQNPIIDSTKEEEKTKEDTVLENNTSTTEEKTDKTPKEEEKEEVTENPSVENKDPEDKQEEKKIGTFSATLYNAVAWANQTLNIRKSANGNSSKIGTTPTGGKMTILSAMDSKTKYIKIKYGQTTGYVYSDYIMINLPDVIPDMYYEITNASSSIYKSAGYSISGVTGKNLYGFTKKYNSKIGKETYYAPLLFPVAKQLQKAYNVAVKQGYNLKVYDSYRPYAVTKSIYSKFLTLYNNNSTVRQKILYDKNGAYWGPGWFLAQSASNHNRGIAVDIALTDKNGKDLKAQSTMHTLDTTSVVKYNNSNANKLKSIMTSVGFETLQSEWWHFEEQSYKASSPVNSFYLK